MLNIKQITNEATNYKTYLKGVELHKTGAIKDVEYTEEDFGEDGKVSLYLAKVTSSTYEYDYDVRVEIEEDKLLDFECDCPAYFSYDGACKHVIALLLHAYYTSNGDANSIMNILQKRYENMIYETDVEVDRMMDQYLQHEIADEISGRQENEKVQLLPHLSFHRDLLQIDFNIGNKRKYVLKDIFKFYQHMKTGSKEIYGKQLELLHIRKSFEEESLPVLDFLLEQYEIMVESYRFMDNYSRYYPITGIRELNLTPSAVDDFFKIYKNQKVSIETLKSGNIMTLLERSNPTIQVYVKKDHKRNGICITYEEIQYTKGRKNLYICKENKLHCCDEEFTRQMTGFLNSINAYKKELFIIEKDITKFCSTVLVQIKPYIRLEGDQIQIEQYEPQEFDAKIYIDAPDKSTVKAKVMVCYDQNSLNLFDSKQDPSREVRRNSLKEFKIKAMIKKYFTHCDPEDEYKVWFEADDEKLYQFVSVGIPEINSIAEVFATDQFKKLSILPPPRISVGVRLESDLLNIDIDTGDLDPADLENILKAYKKNKKYHRLKNGQFLQLDDNSLTGLAQIVDGLDLNQRDLKTGTLTVPKFRAMYLDKILQEGESIHYKRDQYFKNLIKNMKAVEDNDYEVPESLADILRNYQKTGYRWLKTIEQYGFGGILADDMGLGKTLQVIAMLLDAKEKGNTTPSLVVCPTSLVLNWESEIKKFAPDLTVLAVAGNAEQRELDIKSIEQYDAVVTSYDLLKRDIKQYTNKQFQYHIIDEAQYIKNHTTQNAKAVKVITSKQRFALTGTPIENRLSELWSIFDFLMPGFLYHYKQFKEQLEIPIVKEKDEKALKKLGKMTAPFIIRRLKKDVLKELPDKIESVVMTNMEEEQRKLYLANAQTIKQQIERNIAEKGFENSKIAILALLTRLRQICCDPSLCYEDYKGGSAKLESCMGIVEEATSAGHKILIFSQFTSMLDILQVRLKEEKISYFVLQGSTPKEKRAAMVEEFNKDETKVFLISLKAGGTGLNLTSADMVIHFDPWWNIAAQNQATDRAHRIGQKNSVQVYKLIAKDTIEEKIIKLQEGKKALADSIILDGEGILSALSQNQLIDILL